MSAYPGITLSGVGNSPIRPISPTQYANQRGLPLLGLIVTVSPGASLTYSLQVSGDQNPSDGGNWNDHDDLSAQTGSKNGNIAYPVTAIRLAVTGWVSGSVNLAVVQWP